MGSIQDLHLHMLNALQAIGTAARTTYDPLPTDEQLIALAREVAARIGAADVLLLDPIPEVAVVELHDAYDAGRRPNWLDLGHVADELEQLGIPATVVATSGGTHTLYAGTPDDDGDVDDPTRYPVSLGPAGDDGVGRADEMTFGPTGDDDASQNVGFEAQPPAVAAAIAALFTD